MESIEERLWNIDVEYLIDNVFNTFSRRMPVSPVGISDGLMRLWAKGLRVYADGYEYLIVFPMNKSERRFFDTPQPFPNMGIFVEYRKVRDL